MYAIHSQTDDTDSLTPVPGAQRGSAQPDEIGVTDWGIVDRAQRGERGAMEHILKTHRGRVHRLAQSIVRNPMDAEEVAQDVLTTVSNKLDRFRGDSNLSTWIHRIAINTALMHKRRDRSASSLSLDEARIGDTTDYQPPLVTESVMTHQPVDPTLKREFWDTVWTAVDRLDEKYRSVFVLRDVEGLSTEQTATALGLKVPAVKSRLHRARAALRKRLGGVL